MSTTEPLALVHRGKVRDLYASGGELLVMVASDRISAFDVIMAEPIAEKGRVLTAMSAFWCEAFADLAPMKDMAEPGLDLLLRGHDDQAACLDASVVAGRVE